MKRYNNLFDTIFTYSNIKKAYANAIKGKKYYKEVKFIERNKNRYLKNLLEEVVSGKYEVSKYKVFNLFSGEKWREIHKLPMKDRIVQHAIMLYCEPIFRECFIIDTFSSIKGRGIHRGLDRLKTAVKSDYSWYLKLDVKKCYPSLDKQILKNKLRKKFKDVKLLNLFDKIIDSCEKGVPIGNYTSQYFNNFYFTDFDHWIKEIKQIKYYFRYCDDIVIFGNAKQELLDLLQEIKIKMSELHVELKPNYIIQETSNGVNMLGYIVYKDHIRLRKRTKIRFINKCKQIDFDNLTDTDINVLGSYWGIIKYADCKNLWYKYTGVKEFKDLNIKVHDREFVKDILGKSIIIIASYIYYKKGEKRVRLEIKDKENNDSIYISTSAEMIIEAIEQIKITDYPFKTTINVTDKNYYKLE